MDRMRKLLLAALVASVAAAIAGSVVLADGFGGSGGLGGGGASPHEILSDMTGVSVEDIQAARQDGNSLADIAEANGVSTDDYIAAVVDATSTAIDDAVAEGTLSKERAANIKETLAERVTAIVNSTFGAFGHGRGCAVRLGHAASPVVVLSELPGLTVEEIHKSRVEGTSLADIGEANGVSTETYIDEVIAQATAAIDEMVAAGRLSKERAQEIKDGLQERVESIVINSDEPHVRDGFGRHGFGRHVDRSGFRFGGRFPSQPAPAETSNLLLVL